MNTRRPIPVTNEIQMFMHCSQCLQDMPPGVSPREWTDYEVGWTAQGLQVWCKTHECNVIHVDFEGQTHPANTGHKQRPEEEQ